MIQCMHIAWLHTSTTLADMYATLICVVCLCVTYAGAAYVYVLLYVCCADMSSVSYVRATYLCACMRARVIPEGVPCIHSEWVGGCVEGGGCHSTTNQFSVLTHSLSLIQQSSPLLCLVGSLAALSGAILYSCNSCMRTGISLTFGLH